MFKNSYSIIALLLLFSCGDSKSGREKIFSPRVKKETKVVTPSQNQRIVRGDDLIVEISSNEGIGIDSMTVSLGSQQMSTSKSSLKIDFPNRKVGAWKLKTEIFFNNTSETHYTKVIVLPENAPEELTYEVVNRFPHDPDDYTQGLLVNDGFLYESTGQEGESAFKKKNLTTGEAISAVNLSDDFFGEGLALLNDEFYQLTWKAGKGFVYNKNMEQIRTFSYQSEGWGIASFNNQLIMTSGEEKIFFIEPRSFTINKEIEVYDNNGKVDSLNEIEVIDGLIYANVWLKDIIVVIDPETGEVLQRIDCSGMLSKSEQADADVLNGIAYDQATNRIFVTGKYWPTLFEIKLKPKNSQL